MTGFLPGGLYFVGGGGNEPLHWATQRWTTAHPSWANTGSLLDGTYRRSRVNEVAAAIVQDQVFRDFLGTLQSPIGQAVERAALAQWMPAPDAALMTAALTQALKVIRDQNLPVWQRADVLVGACLALIAFGFIVFAIRKSHQ